MLIEAYQPDWADYDANLTNPSQLALRMKLHHIQSSAICKISSYVITAPEDKTLESFIEIFDSQARLLHLQLHEDMGN